MLSHHAPLHLFPKTSGFRCVKLLKVGTRYSQEYLSLLARKGRLEAIKRGRVWHTTQRAVSAYRASIGKDWEETKD